MAMSLAACGSQAAPIHIRCDIDPQVSAKDAAAAVALRDDICRAFSDRITMAAPGREVIRDAQGDALGALELSLNVTSVSLKPTADSITAAFTWRLGDQTKTNSLTMTVVDAPLSSPMFASLLDALWAANQPPL
ncbi:MAG: hypothetical protein WBO29_04935 [Albidovulum sp.]